MPNVAAAAALVFEQWILHEPPDLYVTLLETKFADYRVSASMQCKPAPKPRNACGVTDAKLFWNEYARVMRDSQ